MAAMAMMRMIVELVSTERIRLRSVAAIDGHVIIGTVRVVVVVVVVNLSGIAAKDTIDSPQHSRHYTMC